MRPPIRTNLPINILAHIENLYLAIKDDKDDKKCLYFELMTKILGDSYINLVEGREISEPYYKKLRSLTKNFKVEHFCYIETMYEEENHIDYHKLTLCHFKLFYELFNFQNNKVYIYCRFPSRKAYYCQFVNSEDAVEFLKKNNIY